MDIKRVLVVEDNPEYAAVARDYFSGQSVVEADYAPDYDEAMVRIPNADGALIDCFFPKKTGSSDISLGRQALDKMVAAMPGYAEREAKINEFLEDMDQYVNTDNPVLRKAMREYFMCFNFSNPSENIREDFNKRLLNVIVLSLLVGVTYRVKR